jgi:hypothetical protein
MPSATKFKLPSLGSSASSGGGFVLPMLMNLPTLSGDSSVTGSLAEFANAQLKTSSGSNASQFSIPKLFPSTTQPQSIPMETSLKTEPVKVFIDLKSALVSETEQKKISKVPKKEVKTDIENFVPKFIDCEMVSDTRSKELKTLEQCERITLSQLRSHYKKYSLKSFSKVGKVIRCRFKKRNPRILHSYDHKHNITQFAFDTPSPDDKILAHLNKNKK